MSPLFHRCVMLMSMTVLGMSASGCATDPDYPGFHKPPVAAKSGESQQTAGGSPDLGVPLRVAEASLRGGDAGRAIEVYQTLSQRYPERIDLRLDLANALLEFGALDRARMTFAEVLVKDVDNATAQTGLGRIALKQYRPGDAESAFRSVLARQSGDVVARNGLAVALDFQGRHAESEHLYRQVLADTPDNPMARNNLGLCLTVQGRYPEAINVLLDAVSAPTAPADARHNLALAYGLSGNLQAAREIDQMDLSADDVRANQAFYTATRGLVAQPPVMVSHAAPDPEPVSVSSIIATRPIPTAQAVAALPTPAPALVETRRDAAIPPRGTSSFGKPTAVAVAWSGRPGVYPGTSSADVGPGVVVEAPRSVPPDIAMTPVVAIVGVKAAAETPLEPPVQEASAEVLLSVHAGVYPGAFARSH